MSCSADEGVVASLSAGNVPIVGTLPAKMAIFAGSLPDFGTSPSLLHEVQFNQFKNGNCGQKGPKWLGLLPNYSVF